MRARGFTLVEILVAMLLMGIMTALGYGTYRQARIAAERTAESQQRTHEIEFGLRIIAQDLAQTVPRPVRQPLGSGQLPALRSGAGVATLLDVTRAGWSNTAGAPRGTLQRVSYRLDNETLKRSYLPVLDATLNVQPIERDLLTRVRSIRFRFLDQNRNWSDEWPAPGLNADQAIFARPTAVEIQVDFKDWGAVRRLIEVAG